ncbi:MAG: serine/threonine-protein kinase [Candidatus Aminicenantaceae bacterium]
MTLIGKTIGHIQIVKFIGRGGMGEVYEGYDATLERKVAVKALGAKSRHDPRAKTRFLREARALSALEHPNICQIYDYVEEEEGDYLILEFIEGRDLRGAAKAGMDKAQKLRIAEQLARVLKLAHEKGIVHRDLKPSNVLVTRANEIKVLDFGLSRFIEPKIEEIAEQALQVEQTQTLDPLDESPPPVDRTLTAPGDESDDRSSLPTPSQPEGYIPTRRGKVMGTPLYMSPEQAQGEIAGPASDMYSFGLILQELFTEQLPYNETDSTTKLIEMAKAGETVTVSGVGPDLASLINRLKSLAPAARPTAVETLERLRLIREKPGKRLRRIVVVAVLGAFLFLGLRYVLDLQRERQLAVQARDEATSVAQFLVDLFEISDPGEARGNSITVREILDLGAKDVETKLGDQPHVQARMMETIGTVYRKLGLYKESDPLLTRALEIRIQEFGDDDLRVAESQVGLAALRDDQGRYEESKALLLRGLAIREKDLPQDHPDIAEALWQLGHIFYVNSQLSEAEEYMARALFIKETVHGPDDVAVAETVLGLGAVYFQQDRLDEAEAYFLRAHRLRTSALGEDHPDVARTLNALAVLNYRLRRYQEAIPLYRQSLAIKRKTLGEHHPSVAASLSNIGVIHLVLKEYPEAEKYYLEALDIQQQAFGDEHPDVAQSYYRLANLSHNAEDYSKAVGYYEKALLTLEKIHGPVHAELPPVLHNMALALMMLEKNNRAEAQHLRGLKVREALWENDDIRVTDSLDHLGNFYTLTERPELAAPLYRRAIPLVENEYGPEDPSLAELLLNFGHTLTLMDEDEEAERSLRRSLDIYEKASPPILDGKGRALFNLAYLHHHNLQNYEKAEELYKEALELFVESEGLESHEVRTTVSEYAELLRRLERISEAEALEARYKIS